MMASMIDAWGITITILAFDITMISLAVSVSSRRGWLRGWAKRAVDKLPIPLDFLTLVFALIGVAAMGAANREALGWLIEAGAVGSLIVLAVAFGATVLAFVALDWSAALTRKVNSDRAASEGQAPSEPTPSPGDR